MTDTKSPFFFHLRSDEGRREIWNTMRDYKGLYASELSGSIYAQLNERLRRDVQADILCDITTQSKMAEIRKRGLKTFEDDCNFKLKTMISANVRDEMAKKYEAQHAAFLEVQKQTMIKDHEVWTSKRSDRLRGLETHSTINTVLIGLAVAYLGYKHVNP